MTVRLGNYLELIRAPAVLTVLGDTLAGGSAAGHEFSLRRLALPLASACLYSGGMALNDYADREIDARERPERPIPSGRISPARALATAGALTATGLALGAAGGGRKSFKVALPLAGCIWAYDLLAKPHRVAGPLIMGTCRALDVFMGAGAGALRPAIVTAGILGTHTAGVTVLSRGEVHGTTTMIASAVALSTILLCAIIPAGRTPQQVQKLAVLVASGVYASRCVPAQIRAAKNPTANNALEATKVGIRAMVPLQAALSLRHGNFGAAGALGIVDAVGKAIRLFRKTPEIGES